MGIFVMSRRNIVIPSPDGKESVRLSRGEVSPVPGWAAKTAYFKALEADGKLVVSKGGKGLEPDRGGAEEAPLPEDG